MKYISKAVSGSDQRASILMDRLYHSSIDLQRKFPRPPFPFTDEKLTNQSYQSHSSNQRTSTSTEPSNALPENWIELKDNSSGQIYYANTVTKKTQWERPIMPSTSYASQTPIPTPSQSNTFNTFNTFKTLSHVDCKFQEKDIKFKDSKGYL